MNAQPKVDLGSTQPARSQLMTATSVDEAAQNLLEHGFTRLVSNLPQRFNAVVPPFARLTQEPEGELLKIDHPRERHADGTSDLGLRIARKGDKKLNPRPDEIAEGRITYDETKFVYHHNDRALGYFGQHQQLLRRHREFFFASSLLHNECNVLALEIAENLDNYLPGYHFAQRLMKVQSMSRLRLLRYLCNGTSPSIAQQHRDQCFLTIHIKSDRPGLWLADRRNEYIIADAEETRDDSVLLFFGRKAWEFTRGRLQGIVHGVVDTTYESADRKPRHTGVDFQHIELSYEDLEWSGQHVRELVLPPLVANYGKVA